MVSFPLPVIRHRQITQFWGRHDGNSAEELWASFTLTEETGETKGNFLSLEIAGLQKTPEIMVGISDEYY